MFDHQVNDDFLRELGHVVASFALLDDVLRLFVVGFIDGPQRVGIAITSELATKQRRSIAAALASDRLGSDPQIERVRELLGRAANLEEERNRVLHSYWGPTVGQDGLITRSKDSAKEKHGLRFVHQEYTPAQLHEVGDAMLALASDFEECLDELVAAGLIDNPYER